MPSGTAITHIIHGGTSFAMSMACTSWTRQTLRHPDFKGTPFCLSVFCSPFKVNYPKILGISKTGPVPKPSDGADLSLRTHGFVENLAISLLACDWAWRAQFLHRTRNMFQRAKNHCSVIVWSLGSRAEEEKKSTC